MKPDPGRVTARRLNRSEYNNTIRDLLAVDTNPAKDFPQDDSGYGFDDIGDVLSLPPVLMEQYLSAAEKVVHLALFGPGKVPSTVTRHQPPHRFGADGGDNSRFAGLLPFTLTDYDVTGLALPSALHTTHYFPAEGDYDFKIDPGGQPPRTLRPVHGCGMDRWQADRKDRRFREDRRRRCFRQPRRRGQNGSSPRSGGRASGGYIGAEFVRRTAGKV